MVQDAYISYLVLVRHGQSLWNQRNLFTGWRDPDLTERGEREAILAGKQLGEQKISFDCAFTSGLIRAQRTCSLLLEQLGQETILTYQYLELNERDYGELSGMDKDQARSNFGAEQVQIWRRSYEVAPPGGESLKDTEKRVMNIYRQQIMPMIEKKKSVLVVAHGNSLRAMVKMIENISEEKIINLEIPTGTPRIYVCKSPQECQLTSIYN